MTARIIQFPTGQVIVEEGEHLAPEQAPSFEDWAYVEAVDFITAVGYLDTLFEDQPAFWSEVERLRRQINAWVAPAESTSS